MGVFGNVMKGIMVNLAKEEKPSIGEVYQAGRLLGLEKEDINILLQKSSTPNAMSQFRKYRWVFPVVVILILMFILWYFSSSPGPGSSTYPAGTRYGVISTKDFRKKRMP